MKIFVDTADTKKIRELHSMGLCDGVTTNPSLVKKTGRNFEEVVKELLTFVKGPISVETVEETAEGMIKDAERFAKWGDNIVVKIPMTPEGMKAVRVLKKKKIMTNVTLVFSPLQALLAAKAGADFVSPFIGRLDDAGHFGMDIIAQIRDIFDNYGFETQILAASIRHPTHVLEAALIGADAATVPPEIILKLYNHPLTETGIKKFFEDARATS